MISPGMSFTQPVPPSPPGMMGPLPRSGPPVQGGSNPVFQAMQGAMGSQQQPGKGGTPPGPGQPQGKGGMPQQGGNGMPGAAMGAAGKGGQPPGGPGEQTGKGGMPQTMPGHANMPYRQPGMSGGMPPLGGGGPWGGGNFNGPVNPTSLYQGQNTMVNGGGMYAGTGGLKSQPGMSPDALRNLASNGLGASTGVGAGVPQLGGGGGKSFFDKMNPLGGGGIHDYMNPGVGNPIGAGLKLLGKIF